MPEIKYRQLIDGKWHYWGYGIDADDVDGRIFTSPLKTADSAPSYQYTGFKDKNGKEIYQGELWLPLGCETPRVIVWHRNGWWFQYPNGGVTRPLEWTEDGEIVGNICEHPEFLKGGAAIAESN